jgi:zinc protease
MILRMPNPRSGFWGALATALLCIPKGADAQTVGHSPREMVRALEFEELRFTPPVVRKEMLSSGVEVLFLEDHTLPLVTLYARFKGGYALLPRDFYAAATALPGLIRSGGTQALSPDSVDHLLDFYALQTAFGGGGESTFSSLNTLTKHLEPAIQLWGELLGYPRFDSAEVEIWRGRQIDTETLGTVHSRIFCPEHLIFGIVGDTSWETLEPLLEDMVDEWPACSAPLSEPRVPEMRREAGVFLIPKDLNQSTVVLAQPGGISQGASDDYFASRIGNSILGASGFNSRLVTRVRTEKGWAYSASSLWTAPSRYEGIVGAVTQTKSESTISAVQLILDTIAEMKTTPPAETEVDRAVSQIVNGFVFNFQDPAQIVSRQMFYLSQGLPEDWLERYIRGIQRVSPKDVQRVFQKYVDPEEMIILILGNPADFDLPLETLGKVQIWEVPGVPRGGWLGAPAMPSRW